MRNLALMWVLAACLLGCDGKPPVSTFTDKRDGKVYKIVKIGSQVWFAENLNYVAEGSVCYENKAENCAKYGRLYSWETALKACPAGTHLPTDEEWNTLVNYVGGKYIAGTKLKSRGGWKVFWDKDGNGTDEYSFSALPSGYYYRDYFYNVGVGGYWWRATEFNADNVKSLQMASFDEYVLITYSSKTALLSVRCVQDDRKERRK